LFLTFLIQDVTVSLHSPLVLPSHTFLQILVYSPKFGHSHSNYMGRIADILSEAGHDVSTIVSVIDPEVKDGTKLSKIIRVQPSEETSRLYSQFTAMNDEMFNMNTFDPIGAYFFGKLFSTIFATQCRALLEEPGLVDSLRAEKFDVYLTENFDMCGIGLSELIKPRSLISLSTSNAFGPQLEEFPLHPAMIQVPLYLLSFQMDVNSMWDRIVNFYADFLVRMSFNQMRSAVHAVFKERFGSDFPTMEQISSNSAYVFTNSEPLIDFAVPTMSKVKHLGSTLCIL
ncbi:hypothetical protein PMAYCL1PPCAC_33391, partial [Pristionchus mayeri]